MFTRRVQDAIQEGRVEMTETGLVVPTEGLAIRGIVSYGVRGTDTEWTNNLIVGEGLNYLVAAATGSEVPISNWYIAVFSSDVEVQSSWTAATFAASAGEFINYVGAERPQWQPGAVAAGARNSFASKASFEATEDGSIVRGAALISASGKSSTAGKLLGATRFNTDKPLDTGEILDVGYGLQLSAL